MKKTLILLITMSSFCLNAAYNDLHKVRRCTGISQNTHSREFLFLKAQNFMHDKIITEVDGDSSERLTMTAMSEEVEAYENEHFYISHNKIDRTILITSFKNQTLTKYSEVICSGPIGRSNRW